MNRSTTKGKKLKINIKRGDDAVYQWAHFSERADSHHKQTGKGTYS